MELKKLLKCVLIAFALLFCLLAFVTLLFLFEAKAKAPKLYTNALEFLVKEDYSNAYYNFSRIYPPADNWLNALYYQAKCADLLNDKKTALRKYSILSFIIKNENAAPFFLWRQGQLSDGKRAEKYFLKLKKLYPASEYGIAANWELAKLTSDLNERKNYLLEYIKYSPGGFYIKEVFLELLSPDYELNDMQKIVFADALYENGAYKRAYTILKDVPLPLSWVYMVKILDKMNIPQNVIKVAKKGFTFDNSQYDEDMLNQAVSIYIKYAPAGAVNALEDIYNNARDRRLKGVALFKLAGITKGANAAGYKAKFINSFSGSKYAPGLLFELFLDALKENKTPLALKYGKKYLALYKGDDTPLVLYFVALLKKKTADSTYKEQVNKLLEDYTGSYYSYLAYKNLSGKKFPNVSGEKIAYPDEIKFPHQDDKILADFFVNFANTNDFKPFEDFRINNLLIKSWIEYKKNNKALSAVYARDYIKQSEIPLKRNNPAWQLAYPIYYSKEINYWAQKRGLNPYLILSLIKEESHFNSQIKSEAGAFGLMQLMMPTAQMIAGKSLTVDELTDVNFNIQLGTKYFAYLSDIFSSNEPLCVLSYNSGPNAVKNWIEKNPFLPFDIFVETIPYPETRMYIKKVYGAYWNYLLIWEKIKIHVPL